MFKKFFQRTEKSPQTPAPVPAPEVESASDAQRPASLFQRLKSGLQRTRAQFSEGLSTLFQGKKAIDAELYEKIEEQLILADVGIETAEAIIARLTESASRAQLKDPQALFELLKVCLGEILTPCDVPLNLPESHSPFVILMVGANGNGKTTTIGKLAKYYQTQGKRVMLAAGDTFRAAAVEQLQAWGQRNDVPVIAQHTGADSASVVYDALQAAQSRGIDVLIADTAGRLHTRDDLMQELHKIKKVLTKLDPSAPHETMLVLDAGTGQNALQQASTFQQAIDVTGISLTKLDGTAKGGIIFAIAQQCGLPIRFIGVGEQLDDLRPFQAQDFIQALFESG